MEASEATAGIGHNMPPEETPPPAELTLAERLAVNHKTTVDKVDALRKEANDVKALVTAAETPDDLGVIAGLNDDLVAKMVAVGKAATKLVTAIKDERLDTTKPLRDDVETINGFFNTLELPINRVKSAFAEKVGAYVELKRAAERREAAERARIAEEEAAAKLKEAADAQHSVMGDVLLNEAVKAEEEAQMAANAAVKAGTGPTRTEAGSISQSTKFAFEILDSDKIPLDALRPYIKLADFEKFVRAYVATHKDKKPLPGVRIFPESKTSFR